MVVEHRRGDVEGSLSTAANQPARHSYSTTRGLAVAFQLTETAFGTGSRRGVNDIPASAARSPLRLRLFLCRTGQHAKPSSVMTQWFVTYE